MKALISPNENYRVCQIEEEEFPVAEPLFWVECPQDITTEWSYNAGDFLLPPAPAVEEPAPVLSPIEKLKQFVADNPDVAALLN